MGRPVAAQGWRRGWVGGQSRVGRGGQSSNHEKGGGRVGHHLDIRQFTGPSRIQDPARESAGLVEGRKDLLVLGEAALGLLAEDQLSVILDLEDAPARGDEARLDAVSFLQSVGQTGRGGLVVSNPAVLDGHLHSHPFTRAA